MSKIVRLKNGDKISHKSIEKNIISAKLLEHYTKTVATHEIIPLNTYFDKIGSKLSIADGNIVIGEGVSYVKISAQIGIVEAKSTGQMGFRIYRNEVVVLDAVKYNLQPYENIVIGERLVKVSPGQKLSLRVKGAVGDKISSASITYVTVEVVY